MQTPPPPGAPRYKRSMKNFLINRRFQLRWISAIVVLTALLFGTLGGYIYQREQRSTDAVIEGLSTMYDADEIEIVKDLFIASDNSVLWVLLGSCGLLVVLLAAAGVVLTHKIAGPIYGLTRSMESVRKGRWAGVRGVREGDEFQSLALEWKAVVSTLREKEATEIDELESLAQSQQLPEGVKQAIRGIVERKRALIQ